MTDQKTGYVVTPKCPGEIAEKVQEFFAKHRAEEFSEHIKAEEYKFCHGTELGTCGNII